MMIRVGFFLSKRKTTTASSLKKLRSPKEPTRYNKSKLMYLLKGGVAINNVQSDKFKSFKITLFKNRKKGIFVSSIEERTVMLFGEVQLSIERGKN